MKDPFSCIIEFHKNKPSKIDETTLNEIEDIIIMYPNAADDLLSKKNPKSHKMCLIPLSKWYRNPKIVKNKITLMGIELTKTKKKLKYFSPSDNEKSP